MEQDLYITLIYKKLKGEITKTEIRVLDDWLMRSKKNVAVYNKIELQWRLSENYSPDIEINVKADLIKLKERIKKDDKKSILTQIKVVRLNLIKWIGIAASILVLISVAYQLFTAKPDDYSIITTAENEHKYIILPDGSEIWLNENSELKYPNVFAENKREVKMDGEVFFEITKDKQAPFIIEASYTTIEVLGTSFNVKINPNKTKVDVRKGKVQFSSKDQKIILAERESGIYFTTAHSLKKTKYDMNSFAWKSSILVFNNTPLKETIEMIEKQYKVNITFDNNRLKDCSFLGRFENKTIDEILQYLSEIYGFKIIKISSSSYKLSSGSCQ